MRISGMGIVWASLSHLVDLTRVRLQVRMSLLLGLLLIVLFPDQLILQATDFVLKKYYFQKDHGALGLNLAPIHPLEGTRSQLVNL